MWSLHIPFKSEKNLRVRDFLTRFPYLWCEYQQTDCNQGTLTENMQLLRWLGYQTTQKTYITKTDIFSKLNNNIQMQLHDKLTKAFIQRNVFWSFQLGFFLSISDHVVSNAHFFVSYKLLHVKMKNSKIMQETAHHMALMYQRFTVSR